MNNLRLKAEKFKNIDAQQEIRYFHRKECLSPGLIYTPFGLVQSLTGLAQCEI